MRTHRKQRRAYDMSACVLACVAILGLATMCSFAFGRNHEALTSFQVPYRPPYVPAPDPLKAAELGLASSSTLAHPKHSPAVKAIIVFPRHVELARGGRRVAMLPIRVTSLSDLARQIHSKAWIEQAGLVVTIASPLIVESGAVMTIGGPEVKTVRLLAGATLGANSGRLSFDGVHVLSWDSAGQPINGPTDKPRPSILAEDNARMVITHSVFSNLGWDWNGSYGVSWLNGATGSATSSTFEDNFIGLYTGHVSGLTFDTDTFLANELYGLDPHSDSTNLTISGDLAEDNTGHGIIFSDGVTDSIVTNCISRHNKENGIMMDADSVDNTIRNNNIYDNAGDGIVLSNSPNNQVLGNNVSHNRIGIHITHGNATSQTIVQGNGIEWNEIAFQDISINQSNVVTYNGGQWEPRTLVFVWVSALVLVALMSVLIIGLALWSSTRPFQTPIVHGPADGMLSGKCAHDYPTEERDPIWW